MKRTELVDLLRSRATELGRGRDAVSLHHQGDDVIVLHYAKGGGVREAKLSVEALCRDDWHERVDAQLWPSCPLPNAPASVRTARPLQTV